MNFNADNKSRQILDLFTKNFKMVNEYMSENYKNEIKKYIPSIFKRWYYSTLSKTKCLYSPSNIFSLNNDTYTIYSYVLDVDDFYNFNFKKIAYSLNEHPIITDLKKLIEFCYPCAKLNNDNSFDYEDINKLSLSNSDVYYIEYLILLAKELKLIIDIPSIKVKKVRPAENINSFFDIEKYKILKSILNASIEISAKKLDFFNLNNINYNVIYSFLKKQKSIDEIFDIICLSIGIDINVILFINEKFPEFNNSLSKISFIGNVMDKWFLSIFGNYLHIINPVYLEPYDFKRSINTIYDLIALNKDVSIELFAPADGYTLTYLGEKLIYNEEISKINILENTEFNEAYNFITTEINTNSFKEMLKSINPISEIIFYLKINTLLKTKYFFNIEISENMTLKDLANELSLLFYFENEYDDYSFFINEPNKVPIYYVSDDSSRRSFHKASETKISSIRLKKGDKFIFIPENDKKNKISISVENILTANPYVIYPRIIEKVFY